jgi:hypothetical protein
VIEAATGRDTRVATPNVMSTMVVKGSVPTPLAYSVTPEAAPVFRALLLEPAALYGLWQYPRFRGLVGKDGELPVVRVVEGSAPVRRDSLVPPAE